MYFICDFVLLSEVNKTKKNLGLIPKLMCSNMLTEALYVLISVSSATFCFFKQQSLRITIMVSLQLKAADTTHATHVT